MRATAASPSAASTFTGGSVDRAIEYLGIIVDQETNALRTRAAIDLAEFNTRKNQALLELNRALRALDAGATSRLVASRLVDLRARLDVNRALLKTHLEAVREVASVVADAIRDSESDGTYSPPIRAHGNRP
jgi:hypothetical protein